MSKIEVVVLEKTSTGSKHLVEAGGCSLDGGLNGFNTLCGLRIGPSELEWMEHDTLEPVDVTCKNCKKIANLYFSKFSLTY